MVVFAARGTLAYIALVLLSSNCRTTEHPLSIGIIDPNVDETVMDLDVENSLIVGSGFGCSRICMAIVHIQVRSGSRTGVCSFVTRWKQAIGAPDAPNRIAG
jgi:hypothetical protein